tara:strand:+ start:4470 stop:5000 length:531 start_codon:yes stop_codon:yes gene_type:complete
MSLYEKQKQALELQRSVLEKQLLQIELEKKHEDEHHQKMTGLDKNMAIMSDWLYKTKDLKDYYECKDKAAHYYNGETNKPRKEPTDLECERFRVGMEKLKDTHISQSINFLSFDQQYRRWMRFTLGRAENVRHNLAPEAPSEFMINFVESTFNIFTQLTERIKVLEDKLDSGVSTM